MTLEEEMMEAFGLALNIVQVALQLGETLVDLCERLQEAETAVADRITEVRSHWLRTSMQLNFVRRLGSKLDNEHARLQQAILETLVSKLRLATQKLEGLLTEDSGSRDHRPKVKRWKYMLLKSYLDETIRDLKKWQRLYDPSWFLIMRIANATIDEELIDAKSTPFPPINGGRAVLQIAHDVRDALTERSVDETHIFIPSGSMSKARVEAIQYSSAKLVHREGFSRWLLVDTIPCPPSHDYEQMVRDVRMLACKLMTADPFTFGLLRCRGVVQSLQADSPTTGAFDMVFDSPSMNPPCALRSYLVLETRHTLTERLAIATQMANCVSFVHTLNFVHKNIRPENILGFGRGNTTFRKFYLTGFEQTRDAEGLTYLRGGNAWEKSLYQHPDRQGLRLKKAFCMQHDIYSLGVCLVEVGLWTSFVHFDDDARPVRPAPVLGLSMADMNRPNRVKDHILNLAMHRLPQTMGEMYASIAVNCLTCLDDRNVDFVDHLENKDPEGISIGVKYIEKILMQLENISM